MCVTIYLGHKPIVHTTFIFLEILLYFLALCIYTVKSNQKFDPFNNQKSWMIYKFVDIETKDFISNCKSGLETPIVD